MPRILSYFPAIQLSCPIENAPLVNQYQIYFQMITYTHPVNYVYLETVSIRLHVKVALWISIGRIAKLHGFFAMCVGYDGKVLISALVCPQGQSSGGRNNVKIVKISQVFCFKILKDGNLLCEACPEL